MFSLFWRFFCYLWLTIILVITITLSISQIVNQDTLIKKFHPAFKNVPQDFFKIYQSRDKELLRNYLRDKHQKHHIYIQVLNEEGSELISYRSNRIPKKLLGSEKIKSRNWRQLNQEFKFGGENYLFIYRIPYSEINKWQEQNYIWLFIFLAACVIVLTLISFILTFSITSPLNKLRFAVQNLAANNYQPQNVAKLLTRHDEIGILAQDFNQMGSRLQKLLANQKRLLRDVSHELRSPLSRLKIAVSLMSNVINADNSNNRSQEQFTQLKNKIERECSNLDTLIDEILTLARLEECSSAIKESFVLQEEINAVVDDAYLVFPAAKISFEHPDTEITIFSDKHLFTRIISNLLGNALKFNPLNQQVTVNLQQQNDTNMISIRDFGSGVDDKLLAKLGTPFFRTHDNQNIKGNGLGLAIAKSAVTNLGGKLEFANHPTGGFVATIYLPANSNF